MMKPNIAVIVVVLLLLYLMTLALSAAPMCTSVRVGDTVYTYCTQ